MKSAWPRLAIFIVCLLPLTLGADPASVGASPPFEAHLAKGDGCDPEAHVHVSLKRLDVESLKVELFDADGTSIGTHALEPRKGKDYRTVFTINLSAAVSASVQTALVTAFTTRSGGKPIEHLDARLGAVPLTGCAGQCSPTRIECNNLCFCFGCVSATYSCTDTGGGCEANCQCQECVSGCLCPGVC